MDMQPSSISFELAPGRQIGGDHPCFIIAEIGQNHQGDIEIAKKMIKLSKSCGADCVKFQKSDVETRFNKAALIRPYKSPNAWGPTYGEHKRHLEFSKQQYRELKKYAEEECNICFAASPFDEVPSCDTNNFPYIEHMAKKRRPMIVSSGMQSMETMRKVYMNIKLYHDRFAILQCTSTYPLSPSDVNLRVISTYQEAFPDVPIGYSGHEAGVTISLGAVALGAKVLERHVTLDKTWKGSDHAASLSMDELATLIKEIRLLELALGTPEKRRLASEEAVYRKLGKSIVAKRAIPIGHKLTYDDFCTKCAEPIGIPPEEMDNLIGHELKNPLGEDETIVKENIKYIPTYLDHSRDKFAGKVVGVILARGGSTGIPLKNIREICGKPLLAWSIIAMQKAACFDEIYVSTDSDIIGKVAEEYGAIFHKRDAHAARDVSTNLESLREFIDKHPEVGILADIHCTTPTQKPEQIAKAVQMIKEMNYDSVFSVVRYKMFRWKEMESGESTVPLNFDPVYRPRRQDWNGELFETGAFYVCTKEIFNRSGCNQAGRCGYIEFPAHLHVDIDVPEDLSIAEEVMKKYVLQPSSRGDSK